MPRQAPEPWRGGALGTTALSRLQRRRACRLSICGIEGEQANAVKSVPLMQALYLRQCPLGTNGGRRVTRGQCSDKRRDKRQRQVEDSRGGRIAHIPSLISGRLAGCGHLWVQRAGALENPWRRMRNSGWVLTGTPFRAFEGKPQDSDGVEGGPGPGAGRLNPCGRE